MIRLKKYMIILGISVSMLTLVACESSSIQNDTSSNTETLSDSLNTEYEIPHKDGKEVNHDIYPSVESESQSSNKNTTSKYSDYNEEGQKIINSAFSTKSEINLALNNIGCTAKDLKFFTINGESLDISNMKGKNILIEIIQAECSDCLESVPIVNDTLKSSDKEIYLIPIFINSNEDTINKFYESLKIEKPDNIVIDSMKNTPTRFSLKKTPSLIYIDNTGTISFVMEEKVDKGSFETSLIYAYDDNIKKIYEYKK